MNEVVEKKEEDKVVKYSKASLRLRMAYEKLKPLQDEVNAENLIQRNSLCRCGSRKKWKRCCLKAHETKTLLLEEVIREYNKMWDRVEGMRRELKL
jgi:hypothetical protein